MIVAANYKCLSCHKVARISFKDVVWKEVKCADCGGNASRVPCSTGRVFDKKKWESARNPEKEKENRK